MTEKGGTSGSTPPDTDISTAINRAEAIVATTQDLLAQVKKEPSSPHGMLAAGKIMEIENDLPAAIRWYERALGAEPTRRAPKGSAIRVG